MDALGHKGTASKLLRSVGVCLSAATVSVARTSSADVSFGVRCTTRDQTKHALGCAEFFFLRTESSS